MPIFSRIIEQTYISIYSLQWSTIVFQTCSDFKPQTPPSAPPTLRSIHSSGQTGVPIQVTLMTFPDFETPVTKVKFHPDGPLCSDADANGGGGTVEAWRGPGRVVGRYSGPEGTEGGVGLEI